MKAAPLPETHVTLMKDCFLIIDERQKPGRNWTPPLSVRWRAALSLFLAGRLSNHLFDPSRGERDGPQTHGLRNSNFFPVCRWLASKPPPLATRRPLWALSSSDCLAAPVSRFVCRSGSLAPLRWEPQTRKRTTREAVLQIDGGFLGGFLGSNLLGFCWRPARSATAIKYNNDDDGASRPRRNAPHYGSSSMLWVLLLLLRRHWRVSLYFSCRAVCYVAVFAARPNTTLNLFDGLQDFQEQLAGSSLLTNEILKCLMLAWCNSHNCYSSHVAHPPPPLGLLGGLLLVPIRRASLAGLGVTS